MAKRGKRKGTYNARNTAIVRRSRELLNPDQPMTLRHLYYLLVSDPEIKLKNKKKEYDNLTRLLSKERHKMTKKIDGDLMSGPIDCNSLVDGTRDKMGWEGYADLEAWRDDASYYRLNRWQSQPWYVELWFEKDAITGVVQDIAEEHGIIMRPLRGQASITFLNEAAKRLDSAAFEPITGDWNNREVQVYYFGDHDPAGYAIEKSAKDTLVMLLTRDYGWDASHFTWDTEASENSQGEKGCLYGVNDNDLPGILHWRREGALHQDMFTSFVFEESGSDEPRELVPLPIKEATNDSKGDVNCKKYKPLFGATACELDALPRQELRDRVERACNERKDSAMWGKAGALEEEHKERIENGLAYVTI